MQNDVPGSLNAFGLMAVLLTTVYLTIRFGAKPTRARRVFKGIGLALVISFFGLTLGMHMCMSGNPGMQWLICSLCLGLLLTTIQPDGIRRGAAMGIVLMTVFLAFQYEILVHEGDYTGNPGFERMNRDPSQSALKSIVLLLPKAAAEDKATYPAGWLAEAPFWRRHREDRADYDTCETVTAATCPLWHTPLTGLYGKQCRRLDVWFRGGTVEDLAEKLEYRERATDQR